MSDLPIDSEAIAACDKAEHEYGERLMDLATERALRLGHESVTREDVDACHETAELKADASFMRDFVAGVQELSEGKSVPWAKLRPSTDDLLEAKLEAIEAAQSAAICTNGGGKPLSREQLRCICAEKYGRAKE